MAAYLIVNFDVDDADTYKKYQKGAVPSLGIGESARLVAYDTDTNQVEGENAGHQTVVLEYPTMQEAKAAYESQAYQEVLPLRFQATSKHFGLLVRGA
ncbi:MAG: DUF1330 domain-containing protein [Acidimicrobiia bacterium]|nr:DUF1330 domain-containing protein [Acidimicrobiia bacterium]